MPVGLGNRRPHKHRRSRQSHSPTKFIQPLDQYIAAAAIGLADFSDTTLWAFEREDRRDLDRCERSVVEVALQSPKCGNQRVITDHNANSPAGHVVALGKREEFNGDVFRARPLKDGWSAESIEHNVRVSQIVDKPDAVLTA